MANELDTVKDTLVCDNGIVCHNFAKYRLSQSKIIDTKSRGSYRQVIQFLRQNKKRSEA